jgi:hypothetical protein
MKRTTVNGRSPALPIVDYSAARERAIQWLGDRYLLAKPINAKQDPERRTTPPNVASGSGG